MASRAASAAPFAALAAFRAAAPDFCTSFWAAVASAAAFSAASLAFPAAVSARAEASTARLVSLSARLPSRSTRATNSSMVADSWSRARAMCWPVSMNHSTSVAAPSSARLAYFCTSGPALNSMALTWTRVSSRRESYWLSVRKVVRLFSLIPDGGWEPLLNCGAFMSVHGAGWRTFGRRKANLGLR